MKNRIYLEGGLGNQLFQVSLVMALNAKYGIKLVVDINSYNFDELRSAEILPILDSLNINYQRSCCVNKRVYRSLKKLRKYLFRISVFKDKDYNSFKNKFNDYEMVKNCDFIGFFQYYSHVRLVLKELRESIYSEIRLNQESLNFLAGISEATVAVHVRRGDYVSSREASDLHGVCSPSYYSSGISFFKNRNDYDFNYMVFSDDIKWCKDNFQLIGFDVGMPVVFIERKLAADSYQDLILMSKCKHHIIANSTYSWWAAILADKGNSGATIYPVKWFSNKEITKEQLFPDSWLSM